jgi:choline dehydrogenase
MSKIVIREVYPGLEVQSDEDLWRAIQNSASSFHHPVGKPEAHQKFSYWQGLLPNTFSLCKCSLTVFQVGTVALGRVLEGGSFRIRGLDGIRVIDSSAMPYATGCHPMASVYAFAHYGAQQVVQQDMNSGTSSQGNNPISNATRSG